MSTQSATTDTDADVETGSQILGTITSLRHSPTALAGSVIIFVLALLAVFSTIDVWVFDRMLITTLYQDPQATDTANAYAAPSVSNPLGTDRFGRDVLARIVYGTRIALAIGIVAVGISFFGGIVVGASAAYFGGYVDDVLMRLAEVLYSIPALILALTFMAIFGNSIINLFVAFGVIGIPGYARVMRSEVFSIREQQYIDAAKTSGLSNTKILFREVIPNGLAAVLVQATLSMGGVIIGAAALSFLGFGVSPPTASWGRMLSDARQALLIAPWVAAAPGVMIFLTVMGFNMLGDGLRDAMDPKVNLGQDGFGEDEVAEGDSDTATTDWDDFDLAGVAAVETTETDGSRGGED
jgi:peptide/nickel transport system permease protein